jgi:Zn-dependent protease
MPVSYALVVFELVVMVLSISLHDCAQAWMANRLGDPTARMMGRISMNPMQHYDPLGTFIFPIIYAIIRPPFIMGWSKPVPMTSRNFRNPRRHEVISLLAGPAAQFLLATLALIALIILRHVDPTALVSLGTAIPLVLHDLSVGTENLPGNFPLILFLYFCILVNLLLFVFNLVPLPYFDGGKILMNYLPYEMAKSYERYGMYFMFAFFFVGFAVVMLFFWPFFNVFNNLLGVRMIHG